jgi:hypothetical protein
MRDSGKPLEKGLWGLVSKLLTGVPACLRCGARDQRRDEALLAVVNRKNGGRCCFHGSKRGETTHFGCARNRAMSVLNLAYKDHGAPDNWDLELNRFPPHPPKVGGWQVRDARRKPSTSKSCGLMTPTVFSQQHGCNLQKKAFRYPSHHYS